MDIMALTVFFFLVIYFLACGRLKAFKPMLASPQKGTSIESEPVVIGDGRNAQAENENRMLFEKGLK